jgi:hydrogenase expression/formation protein HypE
MQTAAVEAGVAIVTGDTKVVHRGAADKLFVNSAGIGVIPDAVAPAAANLRPGDRMVVSGPLGDHGIAILAARGELDFETDLTSDCRPLGSLVEAMLLACPEIRAMRDVTRGGLATILNEFAVASGWSIEIDETALPVRPEVRAAAELLGLDVAYLACEGALVAGVPAAASEPVLAAMHAHAFGAEAAVIGEVTDDQSGRLVIRTALGGRRIADLLLGEQLPRIC